MSNLFLRWGWWQGPVTDFFLEVPETSTFNFLTCKSIFHLSEHPKFEYFSQPYWDIQVCKKVKLMERWMDSIEILGSLHMKRGRKIDIHETEKSQLPCGQIYRNVYMFRNDMKFRSGQIFFRYRFQIQHPIWVGLRMSVV